MEDKIRQAFENNLDKDLIEIIISNSVKKENITKVKIRPVIIKDKLYFQSASYEGKQIFHNNETKMELLYKLLEWFGSDSDSGVFRQVEIKSKYRQTNILISKKGKATIKVKNTGSTEEANLDHNRKKSYIIQEGSQVPFLVDLGIMSLDGKVIHTKYDKFRQINRFLEFMEDILPSLEKEKELTIIDFGCGKSYLTFAMYYYLRELKDYKINIIGLDLKKDVIEHCNQLKERYGYEGIKFMTGDIASFEGVDSVDMVVTLHACDTATDYALYKAVKWGARVILSVPCCQHELNGQMECDTLGSIFKYGLLKEKTAALFTDGLRANILEQMGYKTQLLEFIDMEHTPKNILIRAVKTVNAEKKTEWKEYEECIRFLGVKPTLYELFRNERK